MSQKDSTVLRKITNGDISKIEAYDTLGIKDVQKDFSRAISINFAKLEHIEDFKTTF